MARNKKRKQNRMITTEEQLNDAIDEIIEEDSKEESKPNTTVTFPVSKRIIDIGIAVAIMLGVLLMSNFTKKDVTPSPTPEPDVIQVIPEPTPEPLPDIDPTPEPEPEPEPVPLPEGISIDGPDTANLGDLVVITLHGSDKAQWIVNPATTAYTDSDQTVFMFSSAKPGTFTVFCATVANGEPVAIVKTVRYGGEVKPDPTPEPEPEPEPGMKVETWVGKYLPESGKAQYAQVAAAFERAASNIADGTITTDAAAWGFVQGRLKGACSGDDWNQFLADLTERVKKEDCKTVQALGETLDKIAKAIQEKVPKTPVPKVTVNPPKVISEPPKVIQRVTLSPCASGNCYR